MKVDEKRFNFALQCLERWNHAETLRMFQSTNLYATQCALEVFACLVCVEYECYQRLGWKDDAVSEIVDQDFKERLFDLRNFWFHQQEDIKAKYGRFHEPEVKGFERCMELHTALRRVFTEECAAAGGSAMSYEEFLLNVDTRRD